MSELYFLRKMLEPQLVPLVTACADKEDIVMLAITDADSDHAIKVGDINLYLRKNDEFHKELFGLADSSILETVGDGLWMRY